MNDEREGGLIILGIDARDFMRLKAAKMQFAESGIQFICGQNGAGKSCLIEGLKGVFQGLAKGRTPQSSYSDAPIRDGADKATIIATLQAADGSKILVSCEYTDGEDNKKRRLKVTHEDGSPFPSAREMLGEVLADIEFDLDKFANGKKPEDARYRRDEVMKSVPGLEEKLIELAKLRQVTFDARTEANRDVKRLKGALESMEEPEDGLADEEQSLLDLNAQLQSVDRQITERSRTEEMISDIDIEIEAVRAGILELEARIRIKGEQLAAKHNELEEKVRSLNEMPAEAELSVSRDKIARAMTTVEETNRNIRTAQQYRKTQNELKNAQSVYLGLTAEIQHADETKANLLDNADFPIDNLSVNEEDITFKGKPWSVAATSERYKVALATKIAQNPELRALFVDDGNKFDDNSLELIDTIGKDRNIQVLMAYVVSRPEQATERGGVYIEEGMVGA